MLENTTNKFVPSEERFIDIEKAIKSKNPKLLKLLPKPLLKFVKKILHENDLNYAIYSNKHRQGVDFVQAAMEEFGVEIKTIGEENIPKQGGVIMAANHPLGGLDGIAFMSAVSKHRKDIRFFVNDLLMAMKNFAPIFIPVNKHGKNNSEYTKRFEEVYASDCCVLIFPAGLVSRRQEGRVIEDLIWKKSFIVKAIQNKKNIIPVYIEGKNSKKFYNLAYWRKKLGIKSNIEMFFLVDEMYKQKGKILTFIFGEPISWETFTNEHPHEYWAKKVREHVYALHSGDKSKMLPTIKNKD